MINKTYPQERINNKRGNTQMKFNQKILMVMVLLTLVLASIGLLGGVEGEGARSIAAARQPVAQPASISSLTWNDAVAWVFPGPILPQPFVSWNS
jgi:hypothetical protein